MKPDNAIKLPTDADLSEAALEASLELIVPYLDDKMNYGWICVPSQSLSTAVILTKYNSFIELAFPKIHLSIELSCQYEVDEWSVTVNNWDFSKEKSENNPITIWSPGA